MPAPKRPNNAAAVLASKLRARNIRLDKAAQLLREAGWTVIPPEEDPPTSPVPTGQKG